MLCPHMNLKMQRSACVFLVPILFSHCSEDLTYINAETIAILCDFVVTEIHRLLWISERLLHKRSLTWNRPGLRFDDTQGQKSLRTRAKHISYGARFPSRLSILKQCKLETFVSKVHVVASLVGSI